jgi:acylphosphatase
MDSRLHAIVHGDVQGVFYRAHTRERAASLGLSGWVRNNPDGTVEVVAEGPKEKLEDLLAWLRKGPDAAHVERVDAGWTPATGEFKQFRIEY